MIKIQVQKGSQLVKDLMASFNSREPFGIGGNLYWLTSFEDYGPDCFQVTFEGEWHSAVQPWKGEGPPPVGTVCEFAGGTPCPYDPFDKDLKEGMQVTIIAHFKSGDLTLAAFTFDPQNFDRGRVQVEQGNFGCFRPLRTAEQIAADEHMREIRDAIDIVKSGQKPLPNDIVRHNITVAVVEAMIDAGYRKQVAQ